MFVFNSSKKDIEVACKLVKNGELVAFPTETVYGIGCIFDNEKSYQKLNKLKIKKIKKSSRKFYTIMLSNVKDIEKYAFVNEKIQKFLNIILPGPITVVLSAKENKIPKHIKNKTIGIRIPNFSIALKFLKKISKPILAPSLNREGLKPMTANDLEIIKKEFLNEISGIIITKRKIDNFPSTVISLCDNNIKILREGKISFYFLKKIFDSI